MFSMKKITPEFRARVWKELDAAAAPRYAAALRAEKVAAARRVAARKRMELLLP